jgi:hypothetical protein
MGKKALVFLGVVGMAISGCGGGESGISLDNLAGEMAESMCKKLYLCCNQQEIAQMESSLKFQGEGGCRSYFSGSLETYLVTPMKNALAAGRGQYDADKAAACLEAYEKLGCTGSNQTSNFFDECDNPYQGLGAAGAECVNSLECQLGTYCSTNTKKCTAFAGENQACQTKSEPYCGAGLFCDATSSSCVKQKTENSACQDNTECQVGLVCDETGKTCTKPAPVCTGK